MKKSLFCLMLAFVLTIALPIEAFAEHAGFARLRPISNSGVRAMLVFSDNGETLRIRGIAKGLDPTQTYVSLLYDLGSRPGGGDACLPTDESLSFPQMVVNFWKVRPNGIGFLRAGKKGSSYVPLAAAGTASIRLDTQAGQPLPPAPDPNRFVLWACGKVRQ